MQHRSAHPASMALTAALVVGALLVAFPAPSHADVTAVRGSAYGYHAFDIVILTGEQPDTGPTPAVSLASDASDSPRTATAPEGDVVYGPAELFTTGEITVGTEGSVGDGGSVTSSTDIDDVNRGGSEVFDADRVQSTCTATEDGVTASTTVTNGTMRTHAQAEDHDEEVVAIPTNPEPGHTVEGHLHIGSTQDNYRYVFNEQIRNPDGSITVNAVHAYLLGPAAVGELVIGSATCGVTADTTPPPSPTPGECPVDAEPAGFADREAIPPAHRPNVDCAATMGVIRGFAADNTYRPRIQVRRDQMASFIARSLEASGVELPPPAGERFDDVPAGSTHDDAIHRLAAVGIVQGGAGGESADSYGPALRVRRDQMASFLVRAAEYATDRSLASDTQAFGDVPPGNPHFANVNGAAAAGLAQGFGDDTYRPGAVVRRDQMASFIVRLLGSV